MSTELPDLAPSGTNVDSTDPVSVPLVAALAEMAGLMLASSDLQSLLGQISVLAARSASAAPGVDAYCGITMSSEHGAYTVAASDARAAAVDEVQYADGDGPCLQSLRTGEVVSVPDLTVESRWGTTRRMPSPRGSGRRCRRR